LLLQKAAKAPKGGTKGWRFAAFLHGLKVAELNTSSSEEEAVDQISFWSVAISRYYGL
jgi:hypothetical protein